METPITTSNFKLPYGPQAVSSTRIRLPPPQLRHVEHQKPFRVRVLETFTSTENVKYLAAETKTKASLTDVYRDVSRFAATHIRPDANMRVIQAAGRAEGLSLWAEVRQLNREFIAWYTRPVYSAPREDFLTETLRTRMMRMPTIVEPHMAPRARVYSPSAITTPRSRVTLEDFYRDALGDEPRPESRIPAKVALWDHSKMARDTDREQAAQSFAHYGLESEPTPRRVTLTRQPLAREQFDTRTTRAPVTLMSGI